MTIYERLANVQKTLKCPKNQYNSFGKYRYRSCEDILEVAKPTCIENGLVLTLPTEPVAIGNRFYMKAMATIKDVKDPSQTYVVTGYAREEDTKKGMDAAQVSGSAASYAGKYALNGLFCLDDTKDADYTNTGNSGATTAKTNQDKTVTECGHEIAQYIEAHKIPKELITEIIKDKFEKDKFTELSNIQANAMLKNLPHLIKIYQSKTATGTV